MREVCIPQWKSDERNKNPTVTILEHRVFKRQQHKTFTVGKTDVLWRNLAVLVVHSTTSKNSIPSRTNIHIKTAITYTRFSKEIGRHLTPSTKQNAQLLKAPLHLAENGNRTGSGPYFHTILSAPISTSQTAAYSLKTTLDWTLASSRASMSTHSCFFPY